MMRAITIVVLLACVAGVFSFVRRGSTNKPDLAADSRKLDPDAPVVVTDALGRKVSVASTPRRIACLVSFASEMLLALDVKPILRPKIPAEHVYPPEAASIPTFEVNHTAGPDLETLAAAQPDLIIVSPIFARFIHPLEERIHAPVLCVKIDDVSQVPDLVQMLGRATRSEQKASQVAAAHRAEMQHCAAQVPRTGLKVAALFGSPQSFLGFLPESYLGSLLRSLNCTLATANSAPESARRQTAPFSLEKLVASDPDAILLVHHGEPSAIAKATQDDPVWKSLRAVKQGRVYALSDWLVLSNPGLRASQAQAQLRQFLFPAAAGEVKEPHVGGR